MNKTILTTALIAAFGFSGAMADKGGNSEAAKAMADAVKSAPKGIASAVSGGGNGGWGNTGSTALAEGGQVSNRDGNRGAKAE